MMYVSNRGPISSFAVFLKIYKIYITFKFGKFHHGFAAKYGRDLKI